MQGSVRESVCVLGRDVVRGFALGLLSCRAVGSRRRLRCGARYPAWSRRYGFRLAGHRALRRLAVAARKVGRVLLGALRDDRFPCPCVRVIGCFLRCRFGRLAEKRECPGRGAGGRSRETRRLAREPGGFVGWRFGRGAGGRARQPRRLAWESGRLGWKRGCTAGELGGLIGQCGSLTREAGSLTGEPGRPHGNVTRLSGPERPIRRRSRRRPGSRSRRRFRLRTTTRPLVGRRGGQLCWLGMRRLLNRAGRTRAGHTRTGHVRATAHAVGGRAGLVRTRHGVVGRSGVVGRPVCAGRMVGAGRVRVVGLVFGSCRVARVACLAVGRVVASHGVMGRRGGLLGGEGAMRPLGPAGGGVLAPPRLRLR